MERVVVDIGFPLVVREWGGGERSLVFWPGLTPFGALALNEVGPVWVRDYGLRVISISPPGIETPALTAEGYRLSSLAELVVRLFDGLGLERAAYVGYSWGASVGCHLGARFPDRLTALVLLDAGYDDVPDDGKSLEARSAEATAMQAGFRFPDGTSFLAEARAGKRRWNTFSDERALAGMRDEDGELVVIASPDAAAAALQGVIDDPPTAQLEALGKSDVPVLLVTSGERGGDEEGRRAVERFRTALPHAEIVHMPDSGHDLLADDPERVGPIVGAFLARG